MNILKGIGAVLAGVVFIVATHSLTDLILESLGIFTPPTVGFHTTWMVVTAFIYRSIFSVGGGYVTAALAPEPKMRYVAILALVGLVAGTIGAIVSIPMGITQTWYPIALAVSGPIFVWIGGKLRVK
jgi:hypothetical protein